ncbi:MAG: hypothetical protein RL766_158 [Bacteroidota bacterium]|jgi:outer membrane receptor protein involved in Fe transport
MMRYISLSLLFVFLLSYSALKSQSFTPVTIKGIVLGARDSVPASFASVLLKQKDSLIKGYNLLADARFSISALPGKYRLEVYHVTHEPLIMNLVVKEGDSLIQLGSLFLKDVKAKTLDNIIVQAEKSSMQLSLDKKIFNVGKDLANAGGNASDILQNIPSVSVDPDGAVKLRGSDNVRILIDGKPSGLVSIKGGSGLQQLQASLVERVELITNPSARYEAEGMAGIINIVLKKDRRQGFNGSFELITGNPDNYGVAANLNYRKNKINFFVNYGIAHRIQPSIGKVSQSYVSGDSTFFFEQQDRMRLRTFNNNVRAGLDYFFNETSILTAAYLYRGSLASRERNFRYDDFLNSKSNITGYVNRKQLEEEDEPNSEFSVVHKKSFKKKGHEITSEFKYIDYWENSDQTYLQSSFTPDGTEIKNRYLNQKSLNDEFEKQWLLQVDYLYPFGKDGKLETGLRTSFRKMVNDYLVTQQNASGVFDVIPGLDNVFLYDENIHGLYGIISNKKGDFGYQAGLRAEWTDVTTTLKETNEVNPRDYLNFFPSVHFDYQLPAENGLQLSYSRRVRRPFYNDLSPYVTLSDSRSFFSGNPDLNPEFSDVVEIGHIKTFDKGSVTSSLYHRSTTGRIDRIRKVDNLGNAVTRTENLLSEKAFGVELTSTVKPNKWLRMDGNFNLFYAKIDGTNILPTFLADTYSWFLRHTSRFSLSSALDIQWRMNYEAAQKTVQGRRAGLFYADLSASHDILKKQGTLTLNITDVFNSRKTRTTVTGTNFTFQGYSGFRPRQANLTFVYRVKQNKNVKTVKIIQE